MLILLDAAQVLKCDNYYIRELANGLDELIFDIDVWDASYPYLVEEARIMADNDQTYIIKQIDGGENSAKIVCQIDLDDWKGIFHLAYGNGITTVYNTVNAIKPPGWSVQDLSGATANRTINGNLTSYEICEQCSEVFNVWFRWNNDTKVCTIHSKAMPEPAGAFATRDLNLRQINYKGKSNDIKTRLYAYGRDNMTFAAINDGKPYVDNFTYTDKVLPMYWKDERYTIPEDLLADAQTKLAELAVPRRSYECAIIDLKASDPEKYLFMDFSLYTTATLIDDIKNFSVNYQVVERHIFPHYPEKNEVIFDTSPQKITNVLNDTMEILETKASTAEMQLEVDRATGVLQTGLSGYVVINRNSDGYANEILILDTNSIQTAHKVLRINNAGIGFSSNGYAGPYYQAWTLDGHLSLGGVNNAFGHLSILNPSGVEIGSWSKDGIVVDQGIIDLLRNVGGTAKIGLYVNGNVVQIGDFEINDAYGRQIFESTDEKTGMSGEPNTSGQFYLWAGYEDDSHFVFAVNDADAYVMHNASGHPYPVAETLADHEDRIQALEDGPSGGVTDTFLAGGVHWEFTDGLLTDAYET